VVSWASVGESVAPSNAPAVKIERSVLGMANLESLPLRAQSWAKNAGLATKAATRGRTNTGQR
jgi:hypothetical protein